MSIKLFYQNDKGAVYTVRRVALTKPFRRVSFGLFVLQPGFSMWYALPGERLYETMEYAESRLRSLARLNRWEAMSEYAVRGLVSIPDTGKVTV